MSSRESIVKIVQAGTNLFIGKVNILENGDIEIHDCIQLIMNPMSQQVSLSNPLLFGKAGSKVYINRSTPVIITEPSDKVLEEYEKAKVASDTGIVPVKSLPKDGIKVITEK